LPPTGGRSPLVERKDIPLGKEDFPPGRKDFPPGNKSLPSGKKLLPCGMKDIPCGSKLIPEKLDLSSAVVYSPDIYVRAGQNRNL
jgi:hypothetical protein